MLGIPAGSPPASPKLASVRCIQQPSRHQSCRAPRSSLVHTDVGDLASPQADRGNRFNPTSASPNPRQNPHSARGTAATNLPRFRALALFGRRPPERVVRRAFVRLIASAQLPTLKSMTTGTVASRSARNAKNLPAAYLSHAPTYSLI